MPYIAQEARDRLAAGDWPENPGELNYLITRILDHYIHRDTLSYERINTAMGVLACVQQELYRRVAVGYEDHKREINGDVFK